MKIIAAIVFCLAMSNAFAQVDTSQQIDMARQNAKLQQNKPYVILISADGFRYDYAKKYKAVHLLALGKSGVSAQSMIPSYPSTTFPNHYSIVTGMYPAHHGLVGNQFYDPAQAKFYNYKSSTNAQAQWYGGTPIWTLAEQQQMLSAIFYWVGSEAPIKDLRPAYYYHYNEKINIHDRIAAIKNWLSLPEANRPHLIAMYFPVVDQVSHKKGPDAPETEKAVHFIDSAVYELTKAVKTIGLNVNFVFLSDHGMSQIPTNDAIKTPAAIDTSKFIISGEGILVNVYAKKGSEAFIKDTYREILRDAKDFSVYLKADVPAKYHYGTLDDLHNHIGDMVMIPNYPHTFKLNYLYVDPGCHGFEPHEVKDMQATFLAWGPNFKTGLTVPSFENVNVYPIIAKILGLTYTEKIDGTNAVANKIVKPATH